VKPEAYGLSAIGAPADEGVKQGIVRASLSACGTIDERSRFETAPVAILVESPTHQFDQKVKDICEVYLSAMARAEQQSGRFQSMK